MPTGHNKQVRGNLITFVTAFLAALLATPLAAALGRRLRALDYPNERKVHERAIPRIGGLAVAFAFFCALAAVVAFDAEAARHLLDSHQHFVTGLALGSIAIVALGVYDDFRGMPALGKLIVQILIAAALWSAGFRIETIGATSIGLLSLPLTIVWLVGVTNAFNVIDGLDGLSAGVGVFALAILFGVSVVQDSLPLGLLSLALGGALIGFLFFNFNPARIFLGDCGSMFLGLVLGAISIWTHMKSATIAAAVIPLIAFGVPIFDTALAFLRRSLRGVSPLKPDAAHLHHRFLTMGVSHKQAVLDLYTFSVLFGLGAIALLDDRDVRQAMACGLLLVSLLLLLEKAGIRSRLHQRVQHLAPESLTEAIRIAARNFKAIDSFCSARWDITRVKSRMGEEEVQVSHRALDRNGSVAHIGLRWKCEDRPRAAAGERNPSLQLSECRIYAGDLHVRFCAEDHSSPELRDLIAKVMHDAFRDLPVAIRGRTGSVVTMPPAFATATATDCVSTAGKSFTPSSGRSAILSVDVEDWFHILDLPHAPDVSQWDLVPSRVERDYLELLDLFAETNTRATCFFLGWVAERFPHLLRRAAERGHEIACHGYAHQLAYEMTPQEFYLDIVKGKTIIEQNTGVRVLGYRCPGFSTTSATPWFFEKVVEAGFTYDSSVFPAMRGHGGLVIDQLAPHIIETQSGPLIEFPITVTRLLGQRVCCFGGGYLRLSPYFVIKALGGRVSRERRPVIFYVHPREIDIEQPRLPMPLTRRFKCYVNLRGTRRKLQRIARDFEVGTFTQYVDAHLPPAS